MSVFVDDILSQTTLFGTFDPVEVRYSFRQDAVGPITQFVDLSSTAQHRLVDTKIALWSGQDVSLGPVPVAPSLGYRILASTTDLVTVSSATRDGEQGTGFQSVLVAGGISASMTGVAPIQPELNAFAGASMLVLVNGVAYVNETIRATSVEPGQSMLIVRDDPTPYAFTFGQPVDLTIDISMIAEINTSGLNVAPPGGVLIQASANFGTAERRLAWVRLTGIQTADGEPVTDFVVTSASGTDYTVPAPVSIGQEESFGGLKARIVDR